MTIASYSAPLLLLFAVVGITKSTRAAEEFKVDDKVRRKIAEAAAEENSWKVDEVRIDEDEELRRPSCSFYVARHKVRPLSYVRTFALLPDNTVVGIGDGKVVAKVLGACSANASAGWWAEIVARFHQDLGGGIVLHDEKTMTDVTRQLARAGKTFVPPTLDKANQSVSYLLFDPETRVVNRIDATRNVSGAIEVRQTVVLETK
jgi:hypothetical protein